MTRIWLVILVKLFVLSSNALAAPRFSLVKGVLDLSAWNPDEVATLEISGQAEFVWGRLVMQEGWPETPSFIPYPGAWNLFTPHPAKGFASYRLRVKLPQAMKLSLSFPSAWSASAIFINGAAVHQEGRPGRNASSTQSSIKEPFLWTTPEASETLEIVMHVANYDFPWGGPLQSIRLGTPLGLQKAKDRDLAVCLFLVGSLVVMALYHSALYGMRRKDYAAIWFGFFCLSLSVFLLLGQGLSVTTFFLPDDFRLRMQIFSLAWIAATASFMGYCAALFPHPLSRYYTWFMLAAASIAAGLILGIELQLLALIMVYFQGAMALGMLIIGHSVYSAWRQSQESAGSFILVALFLFGGSINDILLMRGLIESIPLAPLGTFLFILGQAYILALRYARVFKRTAESESELRQRNITLEAMVSEKTDHTQRMMDEVQGQRDKLQEVNTYISQHILQRFLPPDLVADLVAGKQTFNDQPSMRDVTIFFADLCSFTAATEWIGPQRVSKTLNEFLALMTQIIFEEGGTIDKFLGDGIMVIFGAPRELAPVDQAERSCRCALRMQEGLAQLNRKWKKEFNHEFQMRVGIHRGPALVGSFGSQLRSDFTAIGNTVNIAARVETQAQAGEVLVTSMVRDYLGSIAWEAAGSYKLKGLAGEMVLFRLLKEDKKRAA